MPVPYSKQMFSKEAGADEGIRTLDLRFTKPLLFRLSYIGVRLIVPSTKPLSNCLRGLAIGPFD